MPGFVALTWCQVPTMLMRFMIRSMANASSPRTSGSIERITASTISSGRVGRSLTDADQAGVGIDLEQDADHPAPGAECPHLVFAEWDCNGRRS